MPLQLPSVSKSSFNERVAELRRELSDAVRNGKSTKVEELCTKNDCDVVLAALFQPSRLYDDLQKEFGRSSKGITQNQRLALVELSTEETATKARQRNEIADRQPLERAQKKNISTALAEWLTSTELGDQELADRCREKLKTYRSHNPKNLIDRRSFPEILAATERDGGSYDNALKTLATEWKTSDDGGFTVKKLAGFIMSKLGENCGVTVDEIEHWLKSPGHDSKLRDKATEAVCFAFGLDQADEARLWRLARGKPSIIISEAATPAELFNALREKCGIPPIRLLPMLGLNGDDASYITRGIDGRTLTLEQARLLLELAEPSGNWLSGTHDEARTQRSWFIATRLGPQQEAKRFGNIVEDAICDPEPHRALMASLVGKNGICPTSAEQLQPLFQKATPHGAYSVEHVDTLRWQKARALTLAEARVVMELARNVCSHITPAEYETCIEILTRCPAPEQLVDRYIEQRDESGKTAHIGLKDTLERIALREGKRLKPDKPETRYIPDIPNALKEPLTTEDRLGNRMAPQFADRMGLTGERRRKFLLKSQHIKPRDPMEIVDQTLGNAITAKEGLKALIEQTGMTASAFAEKHGYKQDEIMHACYVGYTVQPQLPAHLADDIGRPDMADVLTKTFYREKKKDTVGLDEATKERTNFYRSRVVAQALRAGLNNENSR